LYRPVLLLFRQYPGITQEDKSMQPPDQIDVFLSFYHEHRYPDAFITTLDSYLRGQADLADVQQQWELLPLRKHDTHNIDVANYLSTTTGDRLSDVDLRLFALSMLKLSYFINHRDFMRAIAAHGPVAHLCDYLRQQGKSDRDVLKFLMDYIWLFLDEQHSPTALGRVFLTYVPEYADIIPEIAGTSYYADKVVGVLVAADPPYIDLAWQVTQTAEQTRRAQQRERQTKVGKCVAYLLRADPPRFTAWTRQVVAPESGHDPESREDALKALMEHDPASHVDLAVAAFRDTSHGYYSLRVTGLQRAFHFDPETYWHLAEEAVRNGQYGWYGSASYGWYGFASVAVRLMADHNFARALPILQSQLQEGEKYSSRDILRDILLKREWEGQQAYVLSLLTHPARYIRDYAIEWLVQQGEAVVSDVASLLEHSSSTTRLAAVRVLQQIGTPAAHALLAARIDQERARQVKEAIMDIVGAPEIPEQRSPATITAEAEAVLKRVTKPLPAWLDVQQWATLHWTDGSPVAPVVLTYLLYRQSRTKEKHQLDSQIRPVLPLIDRATSSDLAFWLWQCWCGRGEKAQESWLLPLCGALGDDRLVQPLRQKIDAWTRSGRLGPNSKGNRTSLAVRAAHALALLDSDLALAELDAIATRSRGKKRGITDIARQIFDEAAEQLGVSREELLDRATPRLGFNEQGERCFDYGARQFIVHLQTDGTLYVHDQSGKTRKSLPKPGQKDDPEQAASAYTQWKALQSQVKQATGLLTQRLERALVNQRAWAISRWQSLFVQHPLLRAPAQGLVWGLVDDTEPHRLALLFRPLDDGTLTDADDEPVTLPAEGRVRLAHPLDMNEQTLNAWQQHIADYELISPFEQLGRPVVRCDAADAAALWWDACQGYVVNGGTMRSRWEKAGWELGASGHHARISVLWKWFQDAGIDVVLRIDGLYAAGIHTSNLLLLGLGFLRADPGNRARRYDDSIADNDPRLIKLGDVPPIVLSEAASDVQRFAAAGTYDAKWENKFW
jgi:hypothetical protein